MALPTDYLWFWIFIAALIVIFIVRIMLPVYILLWRILLALGSSRETKDRNTDKLYRVR